MQQDRGHPVGVADDLDVAQVPSRQSQRLGDRLLGAEARREVLPRSRARGRVRALPIGEQPLRQARRALQCSLEPVDLEQVEPDASGAGALTRP